MGLKSSLFGKSAKAKSSSTTESGNHAWGAIDSALSPALGYVTGAGNMMSQLLGIGTSSGGQQTALNNFANSAGMNFLKDQGMDMINSNMATKGLLNSGATLKASQQYGQGLASTYLNQFMQNLLGLGGLGLGAGGVMADAGRWSKGSSQSTESGGKKGMLPSLVAAAAKIPGISDPKAKTNVKQIGEASDGLGIYEYEYKFDRGTKHIGVMADEVKEKRPQAFIPKLFGNFDGVDYGKLGVKV